MRQGLNDRVVKGVLFLIILVVWAFLAEYIFTFYCSGEWFELASIFSMYLVGCALFVAAIYSIAEGR